jgi:hypothetical protein
MIKGLTVIMILFIGIFVWAQSWEEDRPENRIKIAVIDTGYDVTPELQPFICSKGHASFVDDFPMRDSHKSKHGTNVVGLIAKNLNPNKHCILIIKFYNEYLSAAEFGNFVRLGIEYAISQNARYINLSLSGSAPAYMEYLALEQALMHGIKVSVAAGNGRETPKGSVGIDLDKKCAAFPACYSFRTMQSNFHVVGSSGSRFSNRGQVVKFWENGNQVGKPALSGTSQAAAIHTGKTVKADSK